MPLKSNEAPKTPFPRLDRSWTPALAGLSERPSTPLWRPGLGSLPPAYGPSPITPCWVLPSMGRAPRGSAEPKIATSPYESVEEPNTRAHHRGVGRSRLGRHRQRRGRRRRQQLAARRVPGLAPSSRSPSVPTPALQRCLHARASLRRALHLCARAAARSPSVAHDLPPVNP